MSHDLTPVITPPSSRCALLAEDVEFVDRYEQSEQCLRHRPLSSCLLSVSACMTFVLSPGVDMNANTDEWITKHCLDADVFVLVSNAESTIMNVVSHGVSKCSPFCHTSARHKSSTCTKVLIPPQVTTASANIHT